MFQCCHCFGRIRNRLNVGHRRICQRVFPEQLISGAESQPETPRS
jgi:hypothetical protein